MPHHTFIVLPVPLLKNSGVIPTVMTHMSSAGNTLTPWSIIFLKNLIVTQLLNKSSAFYGTRELVAMFISSEPRPCVTHKEIVLYGEDLLASRPHHISIHNHLII
jgi:hypothetical protein